MSEWINLTSADGVTTPAYLAHPHGKPRGAVVVLQEIFGVNAHIRAVADGYAQDGYLAIAPSAFHRVEAGVELGYGPEDMRRGRELKAAVEALPSPGVLSDFQAAIDRVASAGAVGVVGYCWGGLLAWRAACMLEGLSAAVAYYGGGITSAAELARQPRVPVMAHFGERDHWIPMDGVRELERTHPTAQVHVYAADHGFNCDQRASFDAAASEAARTRTLAFFAAHLG